MKLEREMKRASSSRHAEEEEDDDYLDIAACQDPLGAEEVVFL